MTTSTDTMTSSPVAQDLTGGVFDALAADSTDEIIEYESMEMVEGVEDLQMYNKGGLHPVHLDDVLDGRFEVLHKLGYGGFGTVWFCRDIVMEKWRAVKIMAADHSTQAVEEKIFSHLRSRCTVEELEDNHILAPLDQFWIEGPNGRHLCLVMPVLGWTVSDWRLNQSDYDEQTGYNEQIGIDAKYVCGQIVEAMHFLHSHGICHGDFKPGNILMKLEGIDELDKDQILEMLGEVDCYEIGTVSGQPTPRAPEYCVVSASPFWCKNLSTKSIAIIDFGESFFVDNPPASTGIPCQYGAPEILFPGTIVPGFPSDIWSLACTLYEVRAEAPLFQPSGLGGFSGIIQSIRFYLGYLPPLYRNAYIEVLRSWRAPRVSSSNRDVVRAQPVKSEPPSKPEQQPVTEIVDELAESRKKFTEGTGYCDVFEADLGRVRMSFLQDKIFEFRYPREDVLELSDLLRRMLNYDPEERISIDEVMSHPWVGKRPKEITISNFTNRGMCSYKSMLAFHDVNKCMQIE
ncbi:kinase-like protein [Hypoxylon fuscum]|nr:kinase-like protein [Hypoxylon fuscum]